MGVRFIGDASIAHRLSVYDVLIPAAGSATSIKQLLINRLQTLLSSLEKAIEQARLLSVHCITWEIRENADAFTLFERDVANDELTITSNFGFNPSISGIELSRWQIEAVGAGVVTAKLSLLLSDEKIQWAGGVKIK